MSDRKNIDGTPIEPEHGTYAMFQKERRQGVTPCEPCRLARNEYHRLRRVNNPDQWRVELERGYARERALAELGRRHPYELRLLINVEMSTKASA